MSIAWLDISGKIYFGLPARLSGLVLFAIYILILAGAAIYKRTRPGISEPMVRGPQWIWLPLLVAAAPLAAQVFVFHLPTGFQGTIPGVPQESFGSVFSLFGALPWMLAGGILGGWQALLVGFFTGLARGALETNSIFTPLHYTLMAGFVTTLMRVDFSEGLGKALRHPFLTAVIASLVFGVLRSMEIFFQTGGELYDAINYAASNLGISILATMLEVGIAGLICEAVKLQFPDVWYKPKRLNTGPYNRSLTTRMVALFAVLGILSSAGVFFGDWVLARSSAQDLIEEQIVQVSRQAGDGIPYFIQTGRSLIWQLSDEVRDEMGNPVNLQTSLDSGIRLVPFFNQLVIFNDQGQIIADAPGNIPDLEEATLEMDAAITAALNGVPQEVVLPPKEGSASARLVFLTPIESETGGNAPGAVAGWTDLTLNPFLLPTVNLLAGVTPGTAYITDELGTILLHPEEQRVMQRTDLDLSMDGNVIENTGSDGTRQLAYTHAISGYPWFVIVSKPQSVVDQLATQLGIRLIALIATAGFIALAAVYFISRSLTRPLGVMAGIAESIARGNLDQEVPLAGEDEIGRLSKSFERMRRSLQARLKEMDLLLDVSQQLATSFELSQILPPILAGVENLTDADYVRLAMAPSATAGVDHPEVFQAGDDPGNWADLDEQILALSSQRGQFILENPARARGVLDTHRLTIAIEALMALPLHHEDQFVGTLWLGHREPHAFSENEVNLLSIIAGQLGISAANAKLYQRAEEERRRLMAVLEATPDAVIVANQDGYISLVNSAAEVVLNVPVDQARGKAVHDVLEAPEAVELLTGPEITTETAEVKTRSGQMLSASVSEIASVQARSKERVCVLWDVTHFKKLDMLKSEFVSTVSHDLRAPLTLMRGYATMLSMVGAMNNQQNEFVRKILESADQMARLVDNLLDLGRIEAGLGLKVERIKMSSVVADVVNSYRPQAINKKLELEVVIDDGLETIEADPALLRQAVANLIDNAIKFTQPKGQVKVHVHTDGEHQLISVEDNGVGIAPADRARLFEKFYRVRNQDPLQDKGSGLGLAIVKSIVDQHEGRVLLESRLGAGSRFSIEIPTQAGLSMTPEENI
jgi:two-component system, OmpR family, phosphate regulon sensor histidine kinase PhoR